MKTLQIFLRKSKATIFFSVLILLSAFLISATVAPTPSSSGVLRLIVLESSCVACGACEAVAPECFIVYDDVANVIVGWENYPDQYMNALDVCPEAAIYLDFY